MSDSLCVRRSTGKLAALADLSNLLGEAYYDPAREADFGSSHKLIRVATQTSIAKASDVKPWLEEQNAYTLHRPVRKQIPRNPYSVTDLLEVSECDLVDVQALVKYNDGNGYLLTVIDDISKYLHIVPLQSKTGKAVSAAIETFK